MRHLRLAILCLVASLAVTLGIAILASFKATPATTSVTYIVPGKPHWAVEGTVVVRMARGPIRTDLWLDPGPYTVRQRGSARASEREAPAWVREVALDHAGPRFAGWKARVAGYGWPRPVLYWLWDWRDEAVEGGLNTTKKSPTPTRGTTEPEAGIPWRIVWTSLAFNWGLFFAIIWIPLVLKKGWRALRRDSRGRCRGCGYDVRGMAIGGMCSECGAPVRDRSRGAMAYRWMVRGLICVGLAVLTTLAVAGVGSWRAPGLQGPELPSQVWFRSPQLGGFFGRYLFRREPLADRVEVWLADYPEGPLDNSPPPDWAVTLTEWGLSRDDSMIGLWNRMTIVSSGWPFRAFVGSVFEPSAWQAFPTQTFAVTGTPPTVPLVPAKAPAPPAGHRVGLVDLQGQWMPWYPRPLELALNLLVFSAWWGLVWLVVAMLHRRAGSRRGPRPGN